MDGYLKLPQVVGEIVAGLLIGLSVLGLVAQSDFLTTSAEIGVIMTATSVSITVETLRERGKLSGKCGTAITSAAIIDDVIGILVLIFVIGFRI